MKLSLRGLVLPVLLAACGSSSSSGSAATGSPGGPRGTATASGSVGGVGVGAQSGVAQSGLDTKNGVYTVGVQLFADAVSCSDSNGTQQENVLGLWIEQDTPPRGLPASAPSPGTYAVHGAAAGATFSGHNAGGSNAYGVAAYGEITLTTVSDTLIEGSFSLQFNASDPIVKGAFSAPVCPTGG